MSDLIVTGMGSSALTFSRTEHCHPNLRFVERNGKRILQQMWSWSEGAQGGLAWRDVPLTDETN